MPREYTRKDLTGSVFGKLTVLREFPTSARQTRRWICRCVCGAETISQQGHLVTGAALGCRACGSRTHGHAGHGAETGEYRVWKSMRTRCENPNSGSYPDYGGRGIRVCDRWASFEQFAADMGPRPTQRHSIDRIDNDLGYEPANCRWATASQQARNQRSNRIIVAFGRSQSLAAWSEETGIPGYTIRRRLERGATPEQALTP